MYPILLIAAKTGYQTRVFAEAAESLGVPIKMATDRCHVLEDPWGDHAIPLRFEEPEKAAKRLARTGHTFSGIVAVGDRPSYIAALAARELELPYHPPEAVDTARNKFKARERFREAGLPVPAFTTFRADEAPPAWNRFPCVLKPLGLSMSRGVIRANNATEFTAAFRRIQAILHNPEIVRMHEEQDRFIQVEDFIPGREFAIEAIATNGELRILAIFDKPDPLNGPFFEETIYVTPSREPEQHQIVNTVKAAVKALGLSHGPVHAEVRVNEGGVWMLEVAARPIGGLCAKAIRLRDGSSLESLIVRHALGQEIASYEREQQASGVMMIPIPRSGIYTGVTGIEGASKHAEVIITAKEGQRFLKLPEGNSYPGFLFARADSPQQAEALLRRAHSELHFEFAVELETVR